MKTLILTAFLFAYASVHAQPAPNFRGELLSGERTSLADLQKKDRGLLLCFWATWCVPCLEELRMVSEKISKDPSLPLDVVTINVDSSETSSDVRSTIAQQRLAFPTILDPKHEIFSRYHQGKSLPFSVLIDGSGNIVSTFEGLQEDMFKTIRTSLSNVKPAAHAE